MKEQTLESQQTISADIELEPTGPSAEEVIKPLDEATYDFDFWEDLRASLPPWINEIVGFALIVFGILSFISLYIAADALVAVTWADMLTSLFGDGAIIVSATLFALGVLLWLPKAGIRIPFTSSRLLALEIAFLSILAVFHLAHSDAELRALARAGQGGGLIGWGLSYPVFSVLGRTPALALFAALIAICLVFAIGLRLRHFVTFFSRFGIRLQLFSEAAKHHAQQSRNNESQSLYRQLAEQPGYRSQIMRIRPNPEDLSEGTNTIRDDVTARSQVIKRVRPANAESKDSTAIETNPQAPATVAPAEASDNGHSDAIPLQDEAAAPSEDMAEQQCPDIWTASLPSIDCLTAVELTMPDEDEIKHNAMLIQNTLLEFDLETTVVDVQVGPTVTRYALHPHKADGSDRIRMSKIASYSRDLSLALAAKRLRMETPVPGTNYMGIEVPNKEPALVALRNVLESETYQEHKRGDRAPLLIPIGRNVTGEPVSLDLSQMPHLLIAGTTGSGKSVCMAAIATALLMQYSPERLRLVMLDPKMVELSRFEGIPHLIGPVEIEQDRIIGVLTWCTQEMDRRYKLLEERGARNIKMYNEEQKKRGPAASPLPYLVIMIDEIGDLMLRNAEETERAITRLAQMARAVGMHLVIATQRPSVDVITGLIKANFPSRIAFSVASGGDSRVIIDRTGAEDLLGKGDMLFLAADAAAPQRIQGCFVSEQDSRAIVAHWRHEQQLRIEAGALDVAGPGPWERSLEKRKFLSETDPMLEEVLKLIARSGEASASVIQRRLGLGYPRAARIMDLLEELGAVGEETPGGRSRKVIIPPGQDPLQFVQERHHKRGPNAL
ncbi:MAG: DNA translocase FtsK [Chloroflexi bacterium]|nr:DNA translocase FtsK [Chloroflexota bacterium]